MIGAIFLTQESGDFTVTFVDRARWEQILSVPYSTPEALERWENFVEWLSLDEKGQHECAEWGASIGAPAPLGNVIAKWHCQRGVFEHGSINMIEVAGMVVT